MTQTASHFRLTAIAIRLTNTIVASVMLSGCASIGKGVTEALLEKTQQEDTRVCQIWGKPFSGIYDGLIRSQGKMKVLMVHGVGDHKPGYTTEFLEKLAKELDLDARSAHYKDIQLSSPLVGENDPLGNLRISHLANEAKGKELIFYELTWSDITREEKELLAFDNSGEYQFRRARINSMLKTFSNDTGPDPIIYLGKTRDRILMAFTQSFCWMVTHDWDDLPEGGKHQCLGVAEKSAEHLIYDDYALISHSLGSRITIDGLQRIAEFLSDPKTLNLSGGEAISLSKTADVIEAKSLSGKKVTFSNKAIDALRKKKIPIFMLSNQLPMLQLGRELPEIAGQTQNYCKPSAPNYDSRMLSETSIIAFSDPNDLLSYAIPPGFSEKYLDSRLCPRITNININIASVIEAFGFNGLANPLDAHVGYDQDDRVVALIAKGIGNQRASSLVKQRCEWTKVIE